MKITLVPLIESPYGGNLALSWALELWDDHIPNYSRQDWINFYTNAPKGNYDSWHGDGQELVFIAKRGEEIVGTIALVDFDDVEEFRHLTPWIAAFIVNPHLRGEGVGTQILELLEEKASSLGIEVLHLWTEDQVSFYSKHGFGLISSAKFGSLDISVMQKKLVGQ